MLANVRPSVFAAALTAAVCFAGCVTVNPDPVYTGGTAGTATVASGGTNTGGIGSGGVNSGSGGQGAGGAISGGSGGAGGLAGQTTAGLGGVGAGSGSAGAGMQPNFEMVQWVFRNSTEPCVAADCHALHTENILELAIDERLYTTLTTHVSMACGNIPVVTPFDPERSALVKILKGPCGETERMPRGCVENEFDNTCVTDDYIAAIEEWIRLGALQ